MASSGQAGPDAKMASQLSQGSDEVITRSSIELELSAKDKEVFFCLNFKIISISEVRKLIQLNQTISERVLREARSWIF